MDLKHTKFVFHAINVAVLLVLFVPCVLSSECRTSYRQYVSLYSSSRHTSSCQAKEAYLNNEETYCKGWCVLRSDDDWLQVKFKGDVLITKISTKGSGKYGGNVKSYYLSFSVDETDWWDYMIDGQLKVFNGNMGDRNTAVQHDLVVPVRATFIRFNPIDSLGKYTCLRVAVWGCSACGEPLGIEDGRVPDSAMTSTKPSLDTFEPYRARLNQNLGNGSWCSKKIDIEDHLRIDLGQEYIINKIATEGGPFSIKKVFVNKTAPCNSTDPNLRNITGPNNTVISCYVPELVSKGAWVEKYMIDYSLDGVVWRSYGSYGYKNREFFGVEEYPGKKIQIIFPTVRARHVAIKPTKCKHNQCLRLELYGCEACREQLGISYGRVPNDRMTASSSSGPNMPWNARLKNPQKAWCSKNSDSSPFLQVDLAITHKIVSIETEGFPLQSSWVKQYKVRYSVNGDEWFFHEENGITKVFTGNSDAETVKNNTFSPPIYAVFVRVIPKNWNGNSACMRIELHGCPVASDPLGLESKEVTLLTANTWHSRAEAHRAGLRSSDGWSASVYTPPKFTFLQVDFGPSRAIITGIATQCSKNWHCTQKYTLRYSDLRLHWTTYVENGKTRVFDGNNITYPILRHNFRNNITARYLMLVVKQTNQRIGVRMELYGQKVCENPLGMANGLIKNNYILASSIKDGFKPWKARLHGPEAWCAKKMDYREYILIHLIKVHRLTAIEIQGYHKNDTYIAYIKEIYISYWDERSFWTWYLLGSSSAAKIIATNLETGNLPVFIPLHPREIVTRQIRIHPRTGVRDACMRLEIYGCLQESPCSSPVGMKSHRIPAESIAASSVLGDEYRPTNGRLGTNTGFGAWCAAIQNDQQFLLIDLGFVYKITGIATQGKYVLSADDLGFAGVQSYKVDYSQYGIHYSSVTDPNGTPKIFLGNGSQNVTATHTLDKAFKGRFVKFRPLTWHTKVCMRVELYGCKDCFSPLGMEDGRIPNNHILGNHWSNHADPNRGRFNHPGYRYGYTYLFDDLSFIEVQFPDKSKYVSAVAVEGTESGAITAYTVSYSPNGADWLDYKENGETKVFAGPFDRFMVKMNVFAYSIKLKHIKLHFVQMYLNALIRLELFGCSECTDAVGLHSRHLFPDGNFSASSTDTTGKHYAYNARLGYNGGWCPKTANSQYLEINFGKAIRICQIAFQGNPVTKEWTRQVRTFYRNDDDGWNMIFTRSGLSDININTDDTSIVRIYYKFPVKATQVKFYTIAWHYRSCLRVEIYKCQECQDEILISKDFSSTFGMSASTQFDRTFSSMYGSMRIGGPNVAWCASQNDVNQYLQFDNILDYKVTGITTVGTGMVPSGTNASWVTKYRVGYSSDEKVWLDYLENSSPKVFSGGSDHVVPTKHLLINAFVARYVRLIPTQWQNWICMRVSLHGCEDNSSPVGVEQHLIKDLKGSFYHDNPTFGRLHQLKGFRSLNEYTPSFYQIGLQISGVVVKAIAMQPSYVNAEGVWSYYLSYSPSGQLWTDYLENGSARIFSGFRDRSRALRAVLLQPITARFVRFYPTRWKQLPSLTVELYGFNACTNALGLSTGALSNSAIRASSYLNGNEPWKGRLDASGIWCSAMTENTDSSYYLQVDLDYETIITGIITVGDAATSRRARSIAVSFMDSKGFWEILGTYVANNLDYHLTKIWLERPINTKRVRVSPSYDERPCMKIELLGCKDKHENCTYPIGIETGLIKNESLSASSTLGPTFKPWYGRINANMEGGGWCARLNTSRQYMEVDLLEDYKITRFMLQGVGSSWVDLFSLEYSHDRFAWTTYEEANQEAFAGTSVNHTMKKILATPFTARYIRVLALHWQLWICMRIEFGGCRVDEPLGSENHKIESKDFSSLGAGSAERARLNVNSYWRANDNSGGDEYLVITICPYGRTITAIAMQGFEHFVTVFTLAYSKNGAEWYDYVTEGKIKMFKNTIDNHLATRHVLKTPLKVSWLKITPIQSYERPRIRLELYGFDTCIDPLGVDSLPQSAFSASTFKTGNEPWRAKLGAAIGEHWCPETPNDQYIAIDLGKVFIVTAIGIEGDEVGGNFVHTFHLGYKEQEHEQWVMYSEYSNEDAFAAELLKATNARKPKVLTKLRRKLQARFVKIMPYDKIALPCLRVEFYGCKVCNTDLGIEIYELNDGAFTASGYLNSQTAPFMARLNSARGLGGWCAGRSETRPYLQVDLFWVRQVNKLAIQGLLDNTSWVKTFTVSYREDGKDWQNYVENTAVKQFQGNVDGNTIVTQELNISRARYIRIHPQTWHTLPCMRLELYGCEAKGENSKGKPLGMQNKQIPDDDITASSFLKYYEPYFARLHRIGNNAWFTYGSNKKRFLLIDLGLGKVTVSRVVTQGRWRCCNEISQFYLAFSRDGLFFYRFNEHGKRKLFSRNRLRTMSALVEYNLRLDIITRYVKITSAVPSYIHIGMRVEVYGHRETPYSLITSSDESVDHNVTSTGNLTNSQEHGNPLSGISWCPEFKDSNSFLAVTFARDVMISNVSVVTQSLDGFFMYYAPSGQSWQVLKYQGVTKILYNGAHVLRKSIAAQKIKFKPKSWQILHCVQVNLFGYETNDPLLQRNQPSFYTMTASSDQHPFHPTNGVFNLDNVHQGWCASQNDADQYLKIDLRYVHVISFIATQGVHVTGMEAWVSSYSVEYSEDDIKWRWHQHKGEKAITVFNGNTNSHLVVKNAFLPALVGRYVKIHPVTWNGSICLRAELYGYSGYLVALGMNTGYISDNAISSSASFSSQTLPNFARLHRVKELGGWQANSSIDKSYIEVDLGADMMITGISTQGPGLIANNYVTSYNVSYRRENSTWTTYQENGTTKVFPGNTNQFAVVTHILNETFISRFVRIIVNTWNLGAALRFELLGQEIPVIDGGFTEFTNWTTCNATCGGGLQSRTRNCTNPVPRNGGQNCTGPSEEIKACNIHLCPAPNVTTPKTIVSTNQLTNFTINNCNQSQIKTIIFGDESVNVTTNECTFQHHYPKPGIFELKISIPRHEYSTLVLYVQEEVSGLAVTSTSMYSLVREEFFINWKLSRGTLPHLVVNFTDGTDVNITVISSVYDVHFGNTTHKFMSPGTYNVSIVSYNLVSRLEIFTVAFVRIPIIISSINVEYHGIFDLYYQLDNMTVNVTLRSGDLPTYRYHMGNGVIISSVFQYLNYTYPNPGTYNLTVEVSNKASSDNITKVIEVYPVVAINDKAHVAANNTVISTPTLVQFDLDTANPYECIFSFGDGKSLRVLSTSNLTNVSNIYAVSGTYTITVQCSNALSSKTLSVVVVIQGTIKGLVFVNDGPKEMNETVTHTATAEDWGTDSCIYVEFGDGSSAGIGKQHCQTKYPGITFKEKNNSTFIFQNMYYKVKVFYTSIHAWNLLSEFKEQKRLPILKISCGYPNTSIVGLSTDIASPTNITRLTALTLESVTNVVCKATNIKVFSWTYFKTSTSKEKVGIEKSISTTESTFLQPSILDYGLHVVRFNVSMYKQAGIWSIADVFLDVVPNDLDVKIDGGQEIERAFDKTVYFDGGLSKDPDYPSKSSLFLHYWLITIDTSMTDSDAMDATLGRPIDDSPQYNEDDFCNMSLPRRLYKGSSRITLFTGKLEVNQTYLIFLVIKLSVSGVTRRNAASQLMTVVVGDPPVCNVRCSTNCKSKVILTDKYSLSASCEEESSKIITYSWEMHIQDASNQWLPLNNLQNLTSTALDNQNIVIKPNALLGGRKYRLIMKAKIVGRRTGRVSMPFIVNDPPYGGKCTVDFPSGLADHTNFTFNCFGWKDDDVPLTYEHSYRNSYGLATTLYYGFKTKITSMLPVGDPTSKFVIIVNARVYDSYRAYSEYQLPVEVKLPPTPKGALLEDLESDLSSNNSEAMKLLSNGKVQEFAQVVNAKMSIVNALSTSEKTEEGRKKGQEMRTNVLKNLHSVTVDSLQGINQIGPTFAATTIAKDEVPLDSQKLILESSETMVSLLDSSFEDGVGTSDVKEASTTLAFLMGNLMAASGDSAKVYGSQSPKDSGSDIESARKAGKEIAKQSTKLVHKMTKSLLNFKVAGEAPTVIKSPSMSIVVSRQQPSQMGNKTLGDGESQVDMPPSDEIFGDTMKNSSFVDAEFLAFPENHNTWDPSAEDVSSTVSLNLKTENSTEIKVDGLSKPFSMYIPRKVPELSPVSNATFIGKEMGSTAFHRYNWSMDSIPLHIIFLANYSDVIIDVYFKYKERPNVKRDPLYVTIPDQSFCTSDSSGLQKCSQEAYAILVNESIVKETGNYYLALKMKRPGGEPQSRTRRDCGTYKRQKRSCLKYKDPPERPPTLPPGVDISKATFVDNVPKYDPEKHMAYSLTTIYSPCKYWNEKKEVWTTNGCKVGKNTKLHAVHCLCNHLTQFGGGLLVAPNPIDFDQVWAGFGNISDNLAVLLTICTAFALYILIGVLVRKKDKKDLLKGGVTIIEIEDGRYLGANSNDYHITVQTGSWQNSATTAKVCMNIIGQKGQSGTLSLQDDTKHLFARGATNEFQVTLPSSLGPLQYLRVWHDMSGEDSSWYLSYVIIRDLNSQQQWIFVCDRWLALDKDDGLVDRLIIVSGDKELKNFKTLFRTKTSQDLFDGHLWLSVIGKPPKSSFTRLQRLSCCMSLLFTTMMTSAMFYNLPGGATDGSSVAIGPLRFSIRQLMIGIQSSFIALPVNVIIIQIFRKARPKPEKNDLDDVQGTVFEFDGISKCENKPEYSNSEEKQKQEGIPYWTVYIAWTLCFLMTLTSATITLFYSMMWGKEISEQWLTSMLVSFFQDAFVTQPIKVCGIALFVAAVLKTLPSDFQNASAGKKVNDEGTSSEASDFHPEACVDFEPPDPEMIEKARQHKLKENQMYGIMKENIFHAVFLLMLVVISYSDRDPMAYYQTNTLNNALSKEVQDPKAFWSYLYGSLLPFAYDGRTSKSDPDLEGYASDKNLYIVGMPRLRQLRVKKVPCSVRLTENICENFYSAFDEVQSFFLPGWKKNSNLTPSVCPEPWRYKGILELNGIPYWGQANFYGGGGYTANLGYNTDQANRVISELKLNKWIDDQTRAIFVELTVYNAYANLFSVLTHLVEMQGLGGSISLLRIETFRLYPNPGPNNSVVMISQFLVLAITFVMTYINCKKIFHLRKEYFQVFWNVIQLVIIILTFVCVGLVIVRKIDAERTIQKVYDNPFVFISFQYTTQWATVNTYVIALIVFLTTLKFLYLMRFNRNIVVLYKTVVRASPKLKLLSLEAFVLFASLVSFSYLYFGRYTNGFGSLLLTIQTLLAMMLGKAYFVELSLTDSILGPVFFVVFAVLMVFFLLNIFIAVLMDTYAEVSEETNLNNKEFEIADFMIQRLKVMVGVSKPIGQPWNVPRLEYIPGVDEETQRRLDLEKSIIDLPKKVQGIHRSLVDLESMSVDIDMAEKEIVEALASHYDTDSLSSEDDSTSTIVLELLQDDE